MIFVPIGFLDGDRPLPHEEALRTLGVRNATVGWDELEALEAGGIRVESHGIGHRPVSELEPAEAAREIALSKLRLEERLGRQVDAYAFVKGSLADYRPEHVSLVQQAGYSLGVHLGVRRQRTVERPLPTASLQRRAVSATDVRARALRRLRPHLSEGHGARDLRSSCVQQGARHGDPLSFEVVRYTPEWRASLVALLARVGTTQLSDEEFTWWFDRNPGGEGIVSLAVDQGEVVGVAAMSFFNTRLEGVETRLAIPVNVATDSRYRGQGVFSTMQQQNEDAAAASGSPLTVTFPNANSYPIFIRRLGWIDLPRLRLWAKPLRVAGVVRYALRREGEQGGMRDPNPASGTFHGLDVRPIDRFEADMDALGLRAAESYGSHFSRDAEYFNWRYLDSPRDYRCFGAYRAGELAGVAVVGHTYKHGVSAGFLADLVAAPDDGEAIRALVVSSRGRGRGRRGRARAAASALVGAAPRARPGRLRADEQEAPLHRQGASRRCPDRRARRRVALHARRLRFLLVTKVVFITQQVDPGHPALAATVPKIRALAELVDEVVVLADGAVEGVLPENCRVRTFRAPHKALRGARFEAALTRELPGFGVALSSRTCARSMPFWPAHSSGRCAFRSSSGSRIGARAVFCEPRSACRPR